MECTACGSSDLCPDVLTITAYIIRPIPKIINKSNFSFFIKIFGVLYMYNTPNIIVNTANIMHNMSPILNFTSAIENIVGLSS